jgi:hypothetical protein
MAQRTTKTTPQEDTAVRTTTIAKPLYSDADRRGEPSLAVCPDCDSHDLIVLSTLSCADPGRKGGTEVNVLLGCRACGGHVKFMMWHGRKSGVTTVWGFQPIEAVEEELKQEQAA